MVDYAHTPDALERLLAALRPLTPGALITVFGCGGDRDRGKRPLMGEAAARASDLVVITSDNPRTEDPQRILADIEPGVRGAGLAPLARATAGARGYVVEPDRPAAIALAVRLARPGDVVVVAGKGHEDYQIIGTEKRHLDDREEVRAGAGAAAHERRERAAAPPRRAFELDDVLAATRGELAQLGDRIRFPGVTTDTRAIRPGELFVAIRGATHDGHHYLAEAARRGAGAVDRGAAPAPISRSTLRRRRRARDARRARRPGRAPSPPPARAGRSAVAGSNGKTTTKEMAAAILRAAFGADARAAHARHAEQPGRAPADAAPARRHAAGRGARARHERAGRGLAPGRDRGTRRRRHHLRGAGAPGGRRLAARRRRGGGRAVPPAAAVGARRS